MRCDEFYHQQWASTEVKALKELKGLIPIESITTQLSLRYALARFPSFKSSGDDNKLIKDSRIGYWTSIADCNTGDKLTVLTIFQFSAIPNPILHFLFESACNTLEYFALMISTRFDIRTRITRMLDSGRARRSHRPPRRFHLHKAEPYKRQTCSNDDLAAFLAYHSRMHLPLTIFNSLEYGIRHWGRWTLLA